MALAVGVDVATAEVRAVAADADGRLRASGAAPLPAPVCPRPGEVEQDAGAWWPAVATALHRLTAALGREASSIEAVSVCATSGTVVALDGRGQPLGPALLYADQRARREAERAQAAGGTRWARLGMRVQPSFGLAKWGWLAAAYQDQVARLAHPSDLVVERLVGARAPTDWSTALKSGYDPLAGQWATEALAALGIGERLVPDVAPPATLAGVVAAEAAAATGLPAGAAVRLGMTDACASQLASGAGTPGRFVSVLGTTLVLKGASRELVTDPGGAVYSHRHPGGWWLPGGASSTGGAVLRARFAGLDLAGLDAAAAEHGPARSVTYPLVGRGERFPFAAPDAEGFELDADEGDVVDRYRAALEGVAFVERLGYERLAALGAPATGPVATTGGGAGSAVWNRVRATVLGVPLIATPAATTALGACVLAAAGSLHADLAAAAEAMAAPGETVEPDRGEQEALDGNYRRLAAALTERGWLPHA
ncbi:MAG TPA: FGGY family carbohydrate kinase [Acidimicrobiales bacterium]|nr:FGGY family carbohydrate kinase [Acidimicrobiales bacterium]